MSDSKKVTLPKDKIFVVKNNSKNNSVSETVKLKVAENTELEINQTAKVKFIFNSDDDLKKWKKMGESDESLNIVKNEKEVSIEVETSEKKGTFLNQTLFSVKNDSLVLTNKDDIKKSSLTGLFISLIVLSIVAACAGLGVLIYNAFIKENNWWQMRKANKENELVEENL